MGGVADVEGWLGIQMARSALQSGHLVLGVHWSMRVQERHM